MNKYQEAYLYIKNYCELDDTHARRRLYRRNIKTLKEAIEKAEKYNEKTIPKKPLKNNSSLDYTMVCPICKNSFLHRHPYCSICGQAIDWNNKK